MKYDSGGVLTNTIPEGALANGLWVGKVRDHLLDTTSVAPSAVFPRSRINGHVVTFESRNVRHISDSALRSLRGKSVFYANDSSSVATLLPIYYGWGRFL